MVKKNSKKYEEKGEEMSVKKKVLYTKIIQYCIMFR